MEKFYEKLKFFLIDSHSLSSKKFVLGEVPPLPSGAATVYVTPGIGGGGRRIIELCFSFRGAMPPCPTSSGPHAVIYLLLTISYQILNIVILGWDNLRVVTTRSFLLGNI